MQLLCMQIQLLYILCLYSHATIMQETFVVNNNNRSTIQLPTLHAGGCNLVELVTALSARYIPSKDCGSKERRAQNA